MALLGYACDATTLFLGFTVFVTLFWYLKSKRKKNFPPGPSGLPLVGYVPFATGNLGEKLFKLKNKYGNVLSIKMGPDEWVVLNDYDVINEAFVKKGEVFSGRPSNEVFDLFTGGEGLSMADYGQTWKNLRKFGLSTLRGFGAGKRGMEENVIEETPFLIESLISSDRQNSNITAKLSYAVSNIICRVVFGSRFAYDDENFVKLQTILSNLMKKSWETKLLGLITFAPVLKHLPVFRSVMKTAIGEVSVFLGILHKIKEDHKSTFDDNDIRDFIDAFLLEMKRDQDDDSAFTDGHLLQYIRELFEGGTATTARTLNWMLLAFLNYPECQDKIYDEIEATLGDSGIPTMKHREEMPYTCAFIQEVMRHRVLLPTGIFHKTSQDVTLRGYDIPKNTTVVPNIWAVHYDPKLFKDPEEFRPERFLDDDGKFVKSNHVIPFSIGPRLCLGEQLAKMEVFIFLTGIVQKLRVIRDPDLPPPDFNTGVYNMLLYDSHPFNVCFERR